MAVTLTFSGRRGLALLALLLLTLCAGPRVVVPLPAESEIESSIRALWAREVVSRGPQSPAGSPADSAAASRRARDLSALATRPLRAIAVRRGWIGPPVGVRWTYFVRVYEAANESPSYYRLSRGFATRASAAAWTLRLL